MNTSFRKPFCFSFLLVPYLPFPALPSQALPRPAKTNHTCQCVPNLAMTRLCSPVHSAPRLPNPTRTLQTSPLTYLDPTCLTCQTLPNHNVTDLAEPIPTVPDLPYHAVPCQTRPCQAPARHTCQVYFVSTWNVPKLPSFDGLHSPTPFAKPPMLMRFTICSALITSGLYLMVSFAFHSLNSPL